MLSTWSERNGVVLTTTLHTATFGRIQIVVNICLNVLKAIIRDARCWMNSHSEVLYKAEVDHKYLDWRDNEGEARTEECSSPAPIVLNS